MAANLRARIFDPFFTTKPDAIGIGLTLAARRWWRTPGTSSSPASSFGGTLFRVVLPACGGGAARGEHPRRGTRGGGRGPGGQSVHRRARGTPRILWIDDDEVFLRGVKRMLGDWDIRTAFTRPARPRRCWRARATRR